ncbi:MAG: hypothetical protein R6V13_00820 [Anaerolineae bacterium]
MNRAAKSVLIFGIYEFVLGLVLLLIPNLLLPVFGFSPTTEPWIRVAGMMELILAYYYIRGAREEVWPLLRWTVHERSFAFVCLAGLVALGLAAPMLALFGLVDLMGAIWTGLALRGHHFFNG